MAELVLVTGGARSGKSRYAEIQARSLPGPWLYVATCPVPGGADGGEDDPEMRERIARHRRRRGREWRTVEEPRDLAAVLARAPEPVVLVDCLALWVSNLLAAGESGEEDVLRRVRGVLAAIRNRPGTVFAVTNEVGCGVVPANALARRFRDCLGRCNQEFGAAADRVVLVVCGQVLVVKEWGVRGEG